MNLNKVFVLGNLTRDPDKRVLPSGQPVVSFGLATNRFYNSKEGEKKQEAEFHNITTFGKLAEISSQYLQKGSLALVEGRLKTNSWQDTAGVKHSRTEIIAERLQLGPRTSGGFPKKEEKQTENKDIIHEEEIPIIEEEDSGEIDPEKIPF